MNTRIIPLTQLARFTKIVARWLRSFILTQLIVTCMSLPILTWWALPISAMTAVGNLLFAPILSLFIMLSAVIVSTEMLGIPNGLFTYMLNQLTTLWEYLLSFGSHRWLFGLTTHHNGILFLFGAITLYLIYVTRRQTQLKRIASFALLLTIIIIYGNRIAPTRNGIYEIPSRRGKLRIECTNGTTALIDSGGLNRFPNPESWIQFTLRPELIRFTASIHIDHVACYRITKSVIETITLMLDHLCVRRITLHLSERTEQKLQTEINTLKHKALDNQVRFRTKRLVANRNLEAKAKALHLSRTD